MESSVPGLSFAAQPAAFACAVNFTGSAKVFYLRVASFMEARLHYTLCRSSEFCDFVIV